MLNIEIKVIHHNNIINLRCSLFLSVLFHKKLPNSLIWYSTQISYKHLNFPKLWPRIAFYGVIIYLCCHIKRVFHPFLPPPKPPPKRKEKLVQPIIYSFLKKIIKLKLRTTYYLGWYFVTSILTCIYFVIAGLCF